MKYERSTLLLAGRANNTRAQMSVQALKVGDWYIHHSIGGMGLSISHISGARVRGALAPVKVVRIVRALTALPPCPLTPDAYREASYMPIPPETMDVLRPWLKQVADASGQLF